MTSKTTLCFALMALLGALSACHHDREPERGPMEQAGHDIDREATQAGREIDDAVDELFVSRRAGQPSQGEGGGTLAYLRVEDG